MAKKDETGRHGEALAARWLEDEGLRVVDVNWRCREGEIDVVALDGDEVVVVEVKTRRARGGGIRSRRSPRRRWHGCGASPGPGSRRTPARAGGCASTSSASCSAGRRATSRCPT
jgi:hypothetical protein